MQSVIFIFMFSSDIPSLLYCTQ